MILNVGCGGSSQYPNLSGFYDINIDVQKPCMKVPNFILCDLHFLPFRDHVFDMICLFEVLEHLGDPLCALKGLRRYLVLHGVLRLSTPNAIFILRIVTSIKRGFYVVARDHILLYAKFELYQLLRKAQYRAITIEYSNYRGLHRKAKMIEKFLVKLCPFKCLRCRTLLVSARVK